MKTIDLIWYFEKADWIFPFYRDGVKAAMEVLENRGYKVRWHLGLDPQVEHDSDFIIIWDNSTSDAIDKLRSHPARKGLILTTDLGMDIEALRKYNVVYAEAQPVYDKIKPHGIRVIKAFGTDTEFFKPEKQKKYFEAFYPATFSPWKRQDVFAERYNRTGLCVGTVQPDGWDIYQACIEYGTQVITGYLPVELIRSLYAMSRKVHITGYEGSGRTVIEALSMGLPVEIAVDNHKCQSYVKEWEESGLEPREFAIQNYSAEVYADQILRGLE